MAKTLFIIPIIFGLILIRLPQQRKNSLNNQTEKVGIDWDQIKSIIPVFVILFTIAFIFASVVLIPTEIANFINQMSKIIMTFALVGIGLGVHINQIKKAGIKPVIIGP